MFERGLVEEVEMLLFETAFPPEAKPFEGRSVTKQALLRSRKRYPETAIAAAQMEYARYDKNAKWDGVPGEDRGHSVVLLDFW